jgi:hypothetical protein
VFDRLVHQGSVVPLKNSGRPPSRRRFPAVANQVFQFIDDLPRLVTNIRLAPGSWFHPPPRTPRTW